MMNLNKNMWAEAVNYAVYILNMRSAIVGKTPNDLWFGRTFDIAHLQDIG